MYIQEFEFWISILSINSDKTFNKYSDEWLYLINYNYPNYYYDFFVNQYNTISNQLNEDMIQYDDVIQLMTTFSKGTVHGYSGFYYTLITYLNNIELYKNLDIILYKDCDYGMLSIINHLCNLGIIKNKIIFLEKNVKYRFKSVTYIENQHHVFNGNLENMVNEFIKKYIVNDKVEEKTKFCILKSNTSLTNISNNGIFDNDVVENFCNKYDITRLLPMNEIELINSIYKCKCLIINYGSTFFKNYVYISDLCEKIIVVVNGEHYKNDYFNLSSIIPNKYQGIIYKKYKNAEIIYVVVDNKLDFDI